LKMVANTSMDIVHTLAELTLSSFSTQTRCPVALEADFSVKEALKTFSTEKVLSCPIKEVHSFLDLFDLLSYLLDLWEDNQEAEKDNVAKLGEKFLNHNICDLTDRSENDEYAALLCTENADKLVHLFGLGVHRVALLDIQGGLTNIISQSDVVKYLNSNIQLLGENATKPIKSLNMISTDDLVVAQADQSTISAFKLLATYLISAVPLVDKRGVLIGTLSVSDLKFLQDDLSPLLLSASQYKSIQEPKPNIVCTRESTLEEVIAKLANSNVHRVWVVDDEDKPISVISITNICEFLGQYLPQGDN